MPFSHILNIKVYQLSMSTLYVLQNQHGYFLAKHKNDGVNWLDGRVANQLFTTLHKDEAINVLFEVNSQDVTLRISIKEYEMNSKKHPIIPENDLPPPLIIPAEAETVNAEIPNTEMLELEDVQCQA